jgi:hypothetical protein
MAGERTFVVKFISDTAAAKAGLKLLSGDIKGFGNQVSKTSPLFGALAVGATAAFGAIAVGMTKAVKAAMEDQKSQVELQRQLEKTFGASETLNKSTEDYISLTQMRTGTSDTSLRTSLGTLIRATGDLQQSQQLLNIAQDVSASTGKDLESVSLALAKASQGQFTALAKLGIPLDENTKKSKDFNQVLKVLNDQFGGAAATSAGTFSGQIKIIGSQIGEVMEVIGAALLPTLQKFSDFIVKSIVPAVKIFVDNVEEEGIGGALAMATATLEDFGVAAINVFESAYLSILSFSNEAAKTVRILANGAALAFGIKGQLGAAAKSLAVAVAMREIQESTGEALSNAGAMFDGFRRQVYLASQELQRFGKPSKDVSDSAERMSQATRSAALANNTFTSGIKEIIPTTGGAAKAIKTAEEKLKEYSKSLKDSTSAQKSFNDAQKSTVRATKSKAEADMAVADAQAKLAQIQGGFGAGSPEALAAQAELAKAQRAQERATYAVEEAIYSVADAEKNLADIRKDPESSPMDIRRAELSLAEAKLAVSDATDSQIESTKSLNDQQTLLNETVFGATIGSIVYDDALKSLTEAKDRQAEAAEAVIDAVDREREAYDRLKDSVIEVARVMAQYPNLTRNMPNPMAGMVGQPAATAGVGAFSTRSGDTYAININAAIAEQGLPAKVVEALQQYNRSVGKIPVTTR